MEFLKRVLSDGDQPSASRVMSVIIVLFACGWVSYLVKVNHALPAFDGLALLIGTPYGLNVLSKSASTVASAMKGSQ
jgi:hypothetical protein